MTRVSVIIPNYNHAAFLKERIESVLTQTLRDFELIILDDCSTDNSRDIIEQYRLHPKVSHIAYNKRNSGYPFKQWQKGVQLAKGEWIWIAESDDVADPIFLQAATDILQNHSSAECYYCDSLIINENGAVTAKASEMKNAFFETQKWLVSYSANGTQELNECLKFLCTINNASAFIFKKNIFTESQNEVTRFRYYGDWFFYLKTILQTDICYNHHALSSCRIHPASFVNKSSPDVETKQEFYRILIFLLRRPEVTKKKELINYFCLRYLGSGWVEEGLGKAVSLMWNYIKIDKRLALKIIPKLVWYKFTRRKTKKTKADYFFQKSVGRI